MKENWARSRPYIEIDDAQILLHLSRITGDEINTILIEQGLSQTNYRISNGDESYILRLVRDRRTCDLESKITNNLLGTLPVSRILGVINTDQINGYLLEELPGDTLNVIDPEPRRLSHIYAQLGTHLAKIHSFTFETTGFFGEDLQIEQEIVISEESYPKLVDSLLTELVSERIGVLKSAILNISKQYSHLIAEVDKTPRLQHGDYNPENILVSGMEVTGILDWEYAFSHHIYFDIGNLLRTERDLDADHVKSFISSYTLSYGNRLSRNWKKIIRLYDLISLLSMLDRDRIGDVALSDIIRLILSHIHDISEGK